ncbi:beta-galactosidase [Moorella thermoacetica Y72]|uniref:Beta-galactosidase n=2 Tax=Neomoorella thermoacetica TaxID=1525 RepID=A0A0S6UED9_NEOTH|nr:beta-galactosidase [Moorella thermoacetica Y72]
MRDHRQTLIRMLLAFSAVLALLSFLISTIWLDRVPLLVAEGKGVTPFKKYMEYFTIAIMILNTFLLLKNRRYFSRSVLVNIGNFFGMTIISEAAFTFYISIYDTYNLLGHIYKVMAYYFLYRAFYLAGIVRYFSNMNEIAALAEEVIEYSDTLKEVLRIYVEKLARIIHRAGQIAIFLPASQENCYYLALCQGQFCQLILEHKNIYLQNFMDIMGRELKILKWPVKTLKGSGLLEVIKGQEDFWDRVVEMFYLPLHRQDIDSGFMWLLNFNKK